VRLDVPMDHSTLMHPLNDPEDLIRNHQHHLQ
jgi:hypothetical protein